MDFIFIILFLEGLAGFSTGILLTLIEGGVDFKDIIEISYSQYKKLNWFGCIVYSLLLLIVFPTFFSIVIGNGLILLLKIMFKLCIKKEIT
jgi:hypothetical protein